MMEASKPCLLTKARTAGLSGLVVALPKEEGVRRSHPSDVGGGVWYLRMARLLAVLLVPVTKTWMAEMAEMAAWRVLALPLVLQPMFPQA